MKSKRSIEIVSCHAEGEVGNVIIGGVEVPPGKTLWEQARWIHEDNTLRQFVLNEPRGGVYERMHTREINKYGGIVSVMPRYAVVFMIFTLGALGLPGTTGFIGEFLILLGTFKVNFTVATIASLGVILGASYMLWLYRRIVFGEITNSEVKKVK